MNQAAMHVDVQADYIIGYAVAASRSLRSPAVPTRVFHGIPTSRPLYSFECYCAVWFRFPRLPAVQTRFHRPNQKR